MTLRRARAASARIDTVFWRGWDFILRRSVNGRWFQPLIKVIPSSGIGGDAQLLDMNYAQSDQAGHPIYEARFIAPQSGQLFLFVNDAAIGPFGPPIEHYYQNNKGEAEVTVEPLGPDG